MKDRLKDAASREGVSMNQLANYLLNRDVTQLEELHAMEMRLDNKAPADLVARGKAVLDRVPARAVPAWDALD